ncbi:hypothetical protein K788_0002171 (plasmid) [Paraburkholderia caribensis MBA4]|uniref:Uncharacterized protein n=1 Tax=Paraburkholderia caribensis MBA4 TaxID=1323664 RepID=A0A0P0RPQ5_9BURK|nr:hypothetical protein [Paraburkholderia caribensis]ALL71000.1 hypothetical protein K788_0002171 [Paraburkholderia caribensis MBA4]
MQVLEALKQAIKVCADVVKWGAGVQEPTRKALANDLQAICANCDAAYDAVLIRLVPIKNAFSDPVKLAVELRAFSADSATRASFKPDHLCGQVDELLIRLSSNLDPLKYSIDFRRIDDVRQYLARFGNFDGAIFQSYDELVAELDRIATQIQTSASDARERARYAEHVIQDFESDLRATQSAVRHAKREMLGLI